MKKTVLKIKTLFILGMMVLLPVTLLADNPPITAIGIISDEEDDPNVEPLDLLVYLNTTTGQISVETYVNQWLWMYILDVETNTVCSIDVIDPSFDYGNIYHTFAPTTIGNYCIYFCSETAQAWGFFSIN